MLHPSILFNCSTFIFSLLRFLVYRAVRWNGEGKSKLFDYHAISMHAISRDATTGFPPCIYCQIDSSDIEDGYFEARFTPQDLTACMPSSLYNPQLVSLLGVNLVENIFDAMSEGAQMNPDPPGKHYTSSLNGMTNGFSLEDNEGDNEAYFNFQEVSDSARMANVEQSLEVLSNLQSILLSFIRR